MIRRSFFFNKILLVILLFILCVFTSLTCKKNPFTPDVGSLTRPVIWLNAFELSFAAFEAGGNPLSQTILVKNAGKNTLNYTISDDAGWLGVEPGSGTSSGQMVAHTISIDKAGLAAQDAGYSATITIVSLEAYNNPQKITVSLKITKEPPPELGVTPLDMTFNARVGTKPSAKSLRVKNTGQGTLNYAITWDASWLSVSPSSGRSTGEENSHIVAVNSASLATGTYSGMITVTSSDASNSPQIVGVTLIIGTVPTDNSISVSCNPSSGKTGATISIPISIRGNTNKIGTFGVDLAFDSSLFQYQSTSKGGLTGNWAMVDGNLISPGIVRIGGFAGSGREIAIGSVGSIAVVTLRVTGSGYSDGHQSQITISGYADDIAGMTPEPSSATFTYRQ